MNKVDLTKCEQGQLFYARLQTGYDYDSAYLVGIIVGVPTKMVFAHNAKTYDDNNIYTHNMESMVLQQSTDAYYNMVLGQSQVLYQEVCYITSDESCREATQEYVNKVVNIQLQQPINQKKLKYMLMNNIQVLLGKIPNYSTYLTRTAMTLTGTEKDIFLTKLQNIDTFATVIQKVNDRYNFLKGVENTYNSFGKVQNKVLGRVYLKKKQSDFDLYAYIGRLDNSTDKPYVFVTLCRNESPNQYSLFANRIRNAKAWYIDTAIQNNRGRVLRMNETKFLSLLETDLQLTNQDSYWTYSLTNRNLNLVEYLT